MVADEAGTYPLVRNRFVDSILYVAVPVEYAVLGTDSTE
jgi:hypothetical protein